MRNAMICASVMLAVFLGWPLAFGDGGKANLEAGKAEARAVAETAPQKVAAAVPAASAPVAAAQPESCYKRYQRTVKQCVPSDPACRQRASDEWDMCEATGFWPD
ncbi:MAG: hypothetical protein ACOY45_09020 [Pseudomonadota bacterium]